MLDMARQGGVILHNIDQCESHTHVLLMAVNNWNGEKVFCTSPGLNYFEVVGRSVAWTGKKLSRSEILNGVAVFSPIFPRCGAFITLST